MNSLHGNINFPNQIKEKYPNLNDSNIFVKLKNLLKIWYCIFEKIIKKYHVYNIIISTSNTYIVLKMDIMLDLWPRPK